MTDEDEWGPWIEHNRRVLAPSGVRTGDMVQCVTIHGKTLTGIVTQLDCWRIVERCRVQRPKGLTAIKSALRDMDDEHEKGKEHAV